MGSHHLHHLYTRKPRLKGIKPLPQGHTRSRRGGWEVNPSSVAAGSVFVTLYATVDEVRGGWRYGGPGALPPWVSLPSASLVLPASIQARGSVSSKSQPLSPTHSHRYLHGELRLKSSFDTMQEDAKYLSAN